VTADVAAAHYGALSDLSLETGRAGDPPAVLERYVAVVESIGGTPRTRVLDRLEAVWSGAERRPAGSTGG
jgi:hypothetical protein